MLLGHYAASLAAKNLSPAVSLGTLFLATQLLDLLWRALVAAGVERVRVVPGITAFTPFDFISYPYSHSLLLAAVWATLFALPLLAAKRAARARDKFGSYAFWAMVALMAVIYVASPLMTPPDHPLALGSSGLLLLFFAGWGHWVDGHREPRPA